MNFACDFAQNNTEYEFSVLSPFNGYGAQFFSAFLRELVDEYFNFCNFF